MIILHASFVFSKRWMEAWLEPLVALDLMFALELILPIPWGLIEAFFQTTDDPERKTSIISSLLCWALEDSRWTRAS
jgi:hypothetical protein